MPAPTFQNLGFELAGAAPGLAASWTLASLASAEELAGYGPVPERPQEDFERGWLGNETFLFALGPTSVEPTLYGEVPESVEDFEQGWSSNETFLRELSSIDAADYEPGTATKFAEDFEALWAGNEAFLSVLSGSELSAAPTEAFEAGWRGNGAFLFALAPLNLGAGSYDTAGTAEGVEDFEELWPNVVMTTV